MQKGNKKKIRFIGQKKLVEKILKKKNKKKLGAQLWGLGDFLVLVKGRWEKNRDNYFIRKSGQGFLAQRGVLFGGKKKISQMEKKKIGGPRKKISFFFSKKGKKRNRWVWGFNGFPGRETTGNWRGFTPYFFYPTFLVGSDF